MPNRRTLAATGMLLALSLTACGAQDTNNGDTAPATDASATEQSPSPQAPQVTAKGVKAPKTADTFDTAAWSVQPEVKASDKGAVTVMAGNVIVHGKSGAVAYDQEGKEVWRLPIEEGSDGSSTTLKPLSPDTFALVTQGASEDGLSKAKAQMRVTVVSAKDGSKIAEHKIDAADSNAPTPTLPGLGVSVPSGTTLAVLPDGTLRELPGASSAATVGQNVLMVKGRNSVPNYTGTLSGPFVTDSWDSASLWGGDERTEASVVASDNKDLVLVRGASGAFDKDASVVLVSAESGKVQAKVPCTVGRDYQTMATSPNGKWNAVGGAIISGGSDVSCVGGEEGQKKVHLSAVMDDGRAFGVTGDDSVFVDARPGEEPRTEQVDSGMLVPAGVLGNGLVVHWDGGQNVLSAHPVKG